MFFPVWTGFDFLTFHPLCSFAVRWLIIAQSHARSIFCQILTVVTHNSQQVGRLYRKKWRSYFFLLIHSSLNVSRTLRTAHAMLKLQAFLHQCMSDWETWVREFTFCFGVLNKVNQLFRLTQRLDTIGLSAGVQQRVRSYTIELLKRQVTGMSRYWIQLNVSYVAQSMRRQTKKSVRTTRISWSF